MIEQEFDLVLNFDAEIHWITAPENMAEKLIREQANHKIHQWIKEFQYTVEERLEQRLKDYREKHGATS